MTAADYTTRCFVSPSGVEVTVIRVSESLDGESVETFGRWMDCLLAGGVVNCIVDCSNVRLVNSRALGVLLKYADEVDKRGGNLVFCRLSRKVATVMEMLGFAAMLKTAADEEEALSYFTQSPSPLPGHAHESPLAEPF